MQILKFGGSSVANAANILKVIHIVQQRMQGEQKTIVVVSALGGITDFLLQCCNSAANGDESYFVNIKELQQRHVKVAEELLASTDKQELLQFIDQKCKEIESICNGIFLLRELTPRSKDKVVSYGELLSSKIISEAFIARGTDCGWLNSTELLTTDNNHGNARVNFELTNQKIATAISNNKHSLLVAPGFIAADESGVVTTLGRGGSDYTAAIFAGALHADNLEIWTDVSGMMTADPRLVKTAKIINRISYQDAMELSHFGAKVIYPPTIQPAMSKGISIKIKNTFSPEDAGTSIEKYHKDISENLVTGLSAIGKIALLSLEGSGMVGVPGFSKRLFEALANEKINVILITQSSSEHSICVGIDEANANAAKRCVDNTFSNEIALGQIEPVKVETGLAILALIGDGMKNHPGISGKLYYALGRNGVNIRAISQGSSERNISTVINASDIQKAISVIHEAFFEKQIKELNVFIAGVGNVGGKLLAQVREQADYLLQKLQIRIKVCGITNSKKMLVKQEGIDLTNWEKELVASEETADVNVLADKIIANNLPNSVFVDITANESVADAYAKLLSKSISIVACNKIAASSHFENYKRLKDLAAEYNAKFLFETNVGAGLPIIGTLNDLISSGDKINSMKAVLSGTLNFVFNNYDGTKPFAEVVRQAQAEGYTEPDPRLDLGGTDVMRKILILAREAGETMEMSDIANNSFMPDACMQGSVSEFYESMAAHESHFKKLYDDAVTENCKLKFVACYENGKAKVGLEKIPAAHDFYHLYGKDNIVLFYTNRYKDQPLVVKGAGAGAEVTASGVFADILRAAQN